MFVALVLGLDILVCLLMLVVLAAGLRTRLRNVVHVGERYLVVLPLYRS